jgi:glc operon protein GlcG
LTAVVVVLDDGGHILVLHRTDNTQVASVEAGIGKARTAAIFRPPSKDFEDQVREERHPHAGEWKSDRGHRR